MSFCSLTKGITPKTHMLCFVLINSVLLNLLCVWIWLSVVAVLQLWLAGRTLTVAMQSSCFSAINAIWDVLVELKSLHWLARPEPAINIDLKKRTLASLLVLINTALTTSLPSPVRFQGSKMYTYTPENIMHYGPITNWHLIMSVLIEVPLRAHAKGGWGVGVGGWEAVMVSSLTLLLFIFRVARLQAWQWQG